METPKATFDITAIDKTKSAFRSIKAGLGGILKSVFSLKAAFIGLTGAGGIGLLIKQSLVAMDRIGKMSKTYGIATKDLAAFELATRIGGSSLEQFAKAARQMSKNTYDYVVRGTGEAVDAFRQLGISQTDVMPIMNDQVALFGLIGDKLNALEDGAVKTAVAYKLLGGRSLELLPALAGGSAAFESYRKEADLLGIALSQNAVKGVEAANDSVARLTLLFRGLRDQTVSALAPALEEVTNKLRDWVINAAEAKGGMEDLGKSLALSIISALKSTLRAFHEFIVTINEMYYSLPFVTDPLLFNIDITPAYQALTDLENKIKGTFGDDKRTPISIAGGRMMTEWEMFVMQMGLMWDNFIDAARMKFSNLTDTFAKGMGDAVANSFLRIKSFSDGMREVFRGVIKTVISGLVEIAAKHLFLDALAKKLQLGQAIAAKSTGAAMALSYAPAAAAASLASFGGNAIPAQAGITSTFALSTALAGIAHDGLDYVPKTGTYLLEKGEKVVAKKNNTGAMTVNFNINAIDAQNATDVIRRNRGQIISMVQSAYNERGRRGGPLG